MFAVMFAGPRGIWGVLAAYRTLREHKNGGPAGTRRLWRPVLYQLSYGPKNCAAGSYRIRGDRGTLKDGPAVVGDRSLQRWGHAPETRGGWNLVSPGRPSTHQCLPLVCSLFSVANSFATAVASSAGQ